METENLKFDKHIFVCTHQRQAGEKPSCGETHGIALVTAFKKMIKDKNIPIKIRAQRAGCLDICHYGPTIVVYPDGIFYVGVSLADVEEIVNSHLINNIPVERLRLPPSKF
ncbi:MAG: (2Fe-2S) ferredoxin domain-containing protein [Bacteroidota bacterium]|jgi:(2Fe-2S) ferredoxin